MIGGRQLIVLEYLYRNLYNESCERKLERCDIKWAIKTVLEGLVVLHVGKRVHTDIKLNNILAKCLPRVPTLKILSLVTLGIRYQKI